MRSSSGSAGMMIRSRHTRLLPLLIALISASAVSAFAFAATRTASPADYRAVLKGLTPGDHLRLMPGEYRDGLPIHFMNGTARMPITISGPDEGPRAVLVARPGHNTVSIINSGYVTIRNLDLDGRGLPVDGVKCEGHADWAHHITLEELNIRGHGQDQQIVGISTKCPAWNWAIRNNVIKGAGTGLYLGNSNGHAPFIAGLIEHNLIVDTIGYNLQIKHQQPRPQLAGMPSGRNTTIIRHNVFSKAKGGARKSARPNVLVGHWPPEGNGSDDLYLIYGNFFYENPHESLFQGEGNFALYNNLMVNHYGDGARIRSDPGAALNISVFYNTVLARAAGIRMVWNGFAPASSQLVEANMVFADSPLHGNPGGRNIVGKFHDAPRYLARPFAPLGEMNLTTIGTGPENSGRNGSRFAGYPDAELDFDGSTSAIKRVGAYAVEKKRPYWLPVLEIKPRVPLR